MATNDKWYFTKEQLDSTPSRRCGYDALKELSYRQQAANFIQDMGQRLKVTQLCINTAIVYMHRFYVFHSFTNFPWHQMASAAIFLAAKVEEQPRKLEYVIRIATLCRNHKDIAFDVTSEKYLAQSQDLVFNENVLLQTLGFDVAIDHPHTHVVRCCQLVRASKDLAQTSYFMASNSLHLTTMCLQYKPTVVACFCIHLVSKWSNWEIPLSNEKKEWFSYVDPSVTADLLQQLTQEFLVIFETCPSRLKEKIMASGDSNIPTGSTGSHINSPFDVDPKRADSSKDPQSSHRPQQLDGKSEDFHKYNRSSRTHDANSARDKEYRLANQMPSSKGASSSSSSSQKQTPLHRHQLDPSKYKSTHQRPPSSSSSSRSSQAHRTEMRDTPRESSGMSTSQQQHPPGDKRQTPVGESSSKYPPGYSGDNRAAVRSSLDHSKVPSGSKQDQQIRVKTQDSNKIETDNIKKHLSVSGFYAKPVHSTSQKVTTSDTPKSSSVLKQSVGSSSSSTTHSTPSNYKTDSKIHQQQQQQQHHHQHHNHHHTHQHNGNNTSTGNGYVNITTFEPSQYKPKDEIPTPAVVKRPSLFSPEKTPPQPHSTSLKTHSTVKKEEDLRSPSTAPIAFMPPVGGSPMDSATRTRHYSTSSEPELRPVMKKIDQVEGFENLLRDSSIGIKKLQQTSDLIATNAATPHDEKPPTQQNKPLVVTNGIETNPTMISNLLKQTPTVPQLTTVTQPSSEPSNAYTDDTKRDSHHKSKKKNKEKHKHKDKEKDKEKKKKHKDKDKHKHSKERQSDTSPSETSAVVEAKPLVLKIQKDKIQPVQDLTSSSAVRSPPSLKIKIPKDKIKTESVAEPAPIAPQVGGLKLKISKDLINSCATTEAPPRKRERDRSYASGDIQPPPAKSSKLSTKDKQNGRHSYNKVHLGDSELSQNRLAESKYTKSSSS